MLSSYNRQNSNQIGRSVSSSQPVVGPSGSRMLSRGVVSPPMDKAMNLSLGESDDGLIERNFSR